MKLTQKILITSAPQQTPKGEIPWLWARDSNGEPRFLITSTPARDMYFLYVPLDGHWKRWGKDASAGKLQERYLNQICSNKRKDVI